MLHASGIEARAIAAELTAGEGLAAAAILVAFIGDPGVEVLAEDAAEVRRLESLGCLSEGKPTPLGMRVATILQTQHGIAPLERGA